jgi:hypothetical protein
MNPSIKQFLDSPEIETVGGTNIAMTLTCT